MYNSTHWKKGDSSETLNHEEYYVIRGCSLIIYPYHYILTVLLSLARDKLYAKAHRQNINVWGDVQLRFLPSDLVAACS